MANQIATLRRQIREMLMNSDEIKGIVKRKNIDDLKKELYPILVDLKIAMDDKEEKKDVILNKLTKIAPLINQLKNALGNIV